MLLTSIAKCCLLNFLVGSQIGSTSVSDHVVFYVEIMLPLPVCLYGVLCACHMAFQLSVTKAVYSLVVSKGEHKLDDFSPCLTWYLSHTNNFRVKQNLWFIWIQVFTVEAEQQADFTTSTHLHQVTERRKTPWWHTEVWQADSNNTTRNFSMPKAISYYDTMVKVASLPSILSAKWTSNTISFKLFACPCALVPLCFGAFSTQDSTNFSPISIVATKMKPVLEIFN